jgi:TctA family transporter
VKLTKTALLLILVGVAVGFLVARFGLPGFGPVSGIDDSALTRPVRYT